MGIEVEPKHAKNLIAICWYRPPTSVNDDSSFNALHELISTLDTEGKEIFLMGDTNCDLKKSKYGPARKLKLIYSEFQFEQQIKNYIRIAPTTNDLGATETMKCLIDHIATNRPNYVIEAGTLQTSFTDHYLAFARRKVNARSRLNKNVRFVETRSLSSYDKNLFLADL